MALRWGILGTARINRRIIPAMRLAQRSELVAVASRDRARAERHAADWSIPRAVAGYQTLVDDPGIDALYIPLPNTEHVPWTLAAIAAGKHVLCEKPLALDPADVDRIAGAAATAGVVVEEGFMYRHEPLTSRVMGLIAEGAIGTVRTVISGFTFALDSPANIRLDHTLGGGALWDVGSYPVTYALLIAGQEPTTVLGSAHWHAQSSLVPGTNHARSSLVPGTNGDSAVDDEFIGVLRFASGGMTATIYAGFRAAYRTWLDVVGSDGSLRVPNPFRPGPIERLEIERNGVLEHLEVAGSPEIFVREIEDFEASVLDGAPQIVSLAESRRTAATLRALYASSKESAE